jgi:membrane-associated protease RseP (regulator of RpoE activity)
MCEPTAFAAFSGETQMITSSLHRVVLTSVLSTAFAACAGAQQDNQAPIAQNKPADSGAPCCTQDAGPHARAPMAFKVQAVPGALIARPVQSGPWKSGGPMLRSQGPRLGVKVAETPDGLQVNSVEEGSLAKAAGVQERDVLLRIGDERVHDIGDIQRALRAAKPGDTVKVAVIRAGEGIVELSGVLPEPKAPPAEPAPPMADGFKGGFLGVQMAKPEEDKDAAGTGGPGVKVEDVVPDSAAWFAGLQKGDRLLAIDGKELANGEDLVGAVSSKEPGSLVELRFNRDGNEQTVKVRLGHRRAEGVFGAFPMMEHGPMVLPSMRMHLDDNDLIPFRLGPDGDPFQMFQDPQGLFGALKGFNMGGPGSQTARIEIRDGKGTMTITRDGKTETYTLDGNGNWVPESGQDGTAPDTNGANSGTPNTDQSPRLRDG